VSESKNIFELIPKVMSDVGAIGKSGTNDFDKYKFRTIDDIYSRLQPALAKHGVFIVPNVIETREEKFKSAKGAEHVRVRLKVKYVLYAGDGSSVESTVEGEGVDRSDKATNKALTAAFKYMLIQVFCIAVENQDDADKESQEFNFIVDKAPAQAAKKEIKNHAPLANDFRITQGKFKSMLLSEISAPELESYIIEVSTALIASGKSEPKWFQDLRKAGGL